MFTVATLATVVLDLMIIEIYFFIIFRIKNPRRPVMITLVWFLFMAMYFALILTLQIPLRVLGGVGSEIDRLQATIPIFIATVYLVWIKREKLKAMRQRFNKAP